MNGVFYIYGAGIVATSIYTAIRELYNCSPKAFLVSGREGNPFEIDGIPVLVLSEIEVADSNVKYLIATPEIHQEVIVESLFQLGIEEEQLILIDNQMENALLEEYYCSLQELETLSELLQNVNSFNNGDVKQVCSSHYNTKLIEVMRGFLVYQAKCHVDKPLNNPIPTPDYVCPIQVGAALTDKVIADVRDNFGDNISHKNRNYCELTGTYFAWKNSRTSYKGLCHYRRVFDISEEQLQTLINRYEDVDVILPYPSVHYPDISGQHKRYINEDDWNAMLMAMKEVAPEYYEAYIKDVSKQRYFYNYNMLIAKNEVFDDYCNFLFTVLEKTEELTVPKGWERADRFAGYLGENLTTIYFRKNQDNLKIVHAGKLWLT